MENAPTSRAWHPGLALVAFAVAYLAGAELGRSLTVGTSDFATFWPPSGLFLAALLLSRRRTWPLVVAAAFLPSTLSNLLHGAPLGLAVGFFAANALESLLAAALVLRLTAGRRPSMASVPDVLALVFGGAVLGTALAASAGAGLLFPGGAPFWDTWVLWWSGSALGVLVATGPVLAFLEREPPAPWGRRRLTEAIAIAGTIALGGFVTAEWPTAFFAREYVLIPPVVWAAIRFGPRGATLSGAVVSLLVVTAARLGHGHIAAGADVLGAVRLFLGLVLTTALLVAAAMEGRRREALARRLVEVAVERASDAVAVVEAATGKVRWVNAALAALLGRSPAEIVDQPVWVLQRVAGLSAWNDLLLALRSGPTPLVREESVPRPGGGAASLELAASRVEVEGEEHVVVVLRDIGDRRQAEAALRLASIGSLAAGVAHEINNPLAYVLGNVRMAREALLREPARSAALQEIDEALADAEEGAIRVRDIVRDLKLFSRPSEGAGPSDARRSMGAALSLARNELRHRARVESSLEEEVPLVAGNEGRLAQVFLNLLVNAAQAIPEGHVEANVVRAEVRRGPEGTVIAEVSDTGVGMAPEVLARVFEPFFTTKPVGTGTGLGLSICHGIVVALGGRIDVESKPGQGSRFQVVLPAAQSLAPQVGPAPPHPAPPAADARPRVLVVDDEDGVGRLVARMLQTDHDVTTTVSGRAGLERLGLERFDAILCDLMMPELTGPELHAELERTDPELASRVVFMTGGAFTEPARRFLERVPNARLEKPFDEALLRAALGTVLARRT